MKTKILLRTMLALILIYFIEQETGVITGLCFSIVFLVTELLFNQIVLAQRLIHLLQDSNMAIMKLHFDRLESQRIENTTEKHTEKNE